MRLIESGACRVARSVFQAGLSFGQVILGFDLPTIERPFCG